MIFDKLLSLFRRRRQPAAPVTLYTRAERPLEVLDPRAPEILYGPGKDGTLRRLIRKMTQFPFPPREVEPLGPPPRVPCNHPTTKVPEFRPRAFDEPNTPQPIVDNANDVTKKAPK